MIKKSDLIKIFIFIVSLNFLGGCNFKVEDNSEEMILINMQNPINENIKKHLNFMGYYKGRFNDLFGVSNAFVSNGCLVDYYPAYKLLENIKSLNDASTISEDLKKIASILSEDDNPVLIMAKLN